MHGFTIRKTNTIIRYSKHEGLFCHEECCLFLDYCRNIFYFVLHTQLWYASLRSLFTYLKTGGSAAELSLKKEWFVSLTPVSVGVESSVLDEEGGQKEVPERD